MKKIIILSLLGGIYTCFAPIELSNEMCPILQDRVKCMLNTAENEGIFRPNDMLTIMERWYKSWPESTGIIGWTATQEGKKIMVLANDIDAIVSENRVYQDALIEVNKSITLKKVGDFIKTVWRLGLKKVTQECPINGLLDNPDAECQIALLFQENKTLPKDKKEICYQYWCAFMLYFLDISHKAVAKGHFMQKDSESAQEHNS